MQKVQKYFVLPANARDRGILTVFEMNKYIDPFTILDMQPIRNTTMLGSRLFAYVTTECNWRHLDKLAFGPGRR